GLLQADQRILNIHADIIQLLPLPDFRLPKRQLIASDIRLSGSIPKWNAQLEPQTVVRETAAEDLCPDATQATQESRVECRRVERRARRAGRRGGGALSGRTFF